MLPGSGLAEHGVRSAGLSCIWSKSGIVLGAATDVSSEWHLRHLSYRLAAPPCEGVHDVQTSPRTLS